MRPPWLRACWKDHMKTFQADFSMSSEFQSSEYSDNQMPLKLKTFFMWSKTHLKRLLPPNYDWRLFLQTLEKM